LEVVDFTDALYIIPIERKPGQDPEKVKTIAEVKEYWHVDDKMPRAKEKKGRYSRTTESQTYLGTVVSHNGDNGPGPLSQQTVDLVNQFIPTLTTEREFHDNQEWGVHKQVEKDYALQTGQSNETQMQIIERKLDYFRFNRDILAERLRIVEQINTLIANKQYFKEGQGEEISRILDQETKNALASLKAVDDRTGEGRDPSFAMLTEGLLPMIQAEITNLRSIRDLNEAKEKYEEMKKSARVQVDAVANAANEYNDQLAILREHLLKQVETQVTNTEDREMYVRTINNFMARLIRAPPPVIKIGEEVYVNQKLYGRMALVNGKPVIESGNIDVVAIDGKPTVTFQQYSVHNVVPGVDLEAGTFQAQGASAPKNRYTRASINLSGLDNDKVSHYFSAGMTQSSRYLENAAVPGTGENKEENALVLVDVIAGRTEIGGTEVSYGLAPFWKFNVTGEEMQTKGIEGYVEVKKGNTTLSMEAGYLDGYRTEVGDIYVIDPLTGETAVDAKDLNFGVKDRANYQKVTVEQVLNENVTVRASLVREQSDGFLHDLWEDYTRYYALLGADFSVKDFKLSVEKAFGDSDRIGINGGYGPFTGFYRTEAGRETYGMQYSKKGISVGVFRNQFGDYGASAGIQKNITEKLEFKAKYSTVGKPSGGFQYDFVSVAWDQLRNLVGRPNMSDREKDLGKMLGVPTEFNRDDEDIFGQYLSGKGEMTLSFGTSGF